MWQLWGKGEVHGEVRWGNMKARNNLEHFGVDGRIILKFIFKK
jgi:hypothetical protein